MSIISFKDTDGQDCLDSASTIEEGYAPKKVLEEEEYLDRMAKIIRRDFFSGLEFSETSPNGSNRGVKRRFDETPGTGQTAISITSSLKSSAISTPSSLNEFFEKYTSEDNDYFERQQRNEIRRHRLKYPWLCNSRRDHNEEVRKQLTLPSRQLSLEQSRTSNKAIAWPYNPKNSLFYPPSDNEKRNKVVINHHSSKYINDPIFKIPITPSRPDRPQSFMRSSDKIGIDGNLINGPETPLRSDFSLTSAPDVPQFLFNSSKIKTEPSKYYLLNESPRDELAHRVYNERVAKFIRTPKHGGPSRTPSLNSTSTRKDFTDFSFSPDRIKTPISRMSKR